MTNRASRKTLRRRRGYTAVEVLVAMTVFAIGAAGVIGMMKVTVQGGADARRRDLATSIAHEWTGRLQRDAMTWTLPNATNPTSNLMTNTRWLKDIGVSGCTGTSFCTPAIPTTGNEPGSSPAFDLFGRDMPTYAAGASEHFFCVQYRLVWIADPNNSTQCGGVEPCKTALMRADVRVYWKRGEYGYIPDCSAATNPTATPNQYHFVYATTGIRENQLQ
jgi:prepilin-type N-terminal cleavage/methylation domain-containing protein